jgi:hypothetical protein
MKCPSNFVIWLLAVHLNAFADSPPNFTGTWIFSAADSQNVGMMAALKYTATVTQTGKLLTVRDDSIYNGATQTRQNTFDLTGMPTTNDSPMGEKAQTVSHWDGAKLVTTWTTIGAVEGTSVTRTEIRSISLDGKTLTVESSRGAKPPMVLVFHQK